MTKAEKKEYNHKRYLKNKTKINAYYKEYYKKHKNKLKKQFLAYAKANGYKCQFNWNKNHPEVLKKYRKDNAEYLNFYNRRRYWKNPEFYRARNRIYNKLYRIKKISIT